MGSRIARRSGGRFVGSVAVRVGDGDDAMVARRAVGGPVAFAGAVRVVALVVVVVVRQEGCACCRCWVLKIAAWTPRVVDGGVVVAAAAVVV